MPAYSPAACPKCQSTQVYPNDVQRVSKFTPELVFTAFHCPCGHSFLTATNRFPHLSQAPEPAPGNKSDP